MSDKTPVCAPMPTMLDPSARPAMLEGNVIRTKVTIEPPVDWRGRAEKAEARVAEMESAASRLIYGHGASDTHVVISRSEWSLFRNAFAGTADPRPDEAPIAVGDRVRITRGEDLVARSQTMDSGVEVQLVPLQAVLGICDEERKYWERRCEGGDLPSSDIDASDGWAAAENIAGRVAKLSEGSNGGRVAPAAPSAPAPKVDPAVLAWIERSMSFWSESGRLSEAERRIATGTLRALHRELIEGDHLVSAEEAPAPRAIGIMGKGNI